MARINRTLALSTGVPVRLSDWATSAAAGELAQPLRAMYIQKLWIQLAAGAVNPLKVCLGVKPGVTPTGADGELSALVSPASQSANTLPGGGFSDPQVPWGSVIGGSEDATRAWILGTTGDSAIVTYMTMDM